ncbi:hypothetical protein P3X46_032902 [Hevea brasiliensis]|uniref:Uncharacterized protein n=1 Tax=Hevea brasiliensis TaxID=3981 RepID=A0ABQ9KEQ5_HEVBR|nr:hypothetical protein P3X46_032902 [Hevea brasiliensis]
MACLSCRCVSRQLVFASFSSNIDGSPPPHSNTTPSHNNKNKPPIPTTKSKTRTKRRQSKLQQRLTLFQIECAVGAGRSVAEFWCAFEGPVEKKLRETGEWSVDKTEGQFCSSGKRILMFFFRWVLPIYIFMFLVTSGVVKLP